MNTKPKIYIEGDGVFGSFLKVLLEPYCDFDSRMETVILAVPSHAYYQRAEFWGHNNEKHIVNVCSVQRETAKNCQVWTDNVTSIHPLFGPRTPADKRFSICTHVCDSVEENKFLEIWNKISPIHYTDPDTHDQIMAKTHVAAVIAAKQLQPFVDMAKDVPDEFIPHSFRMLREFVKQLEDMPKGTMDSILSNPYF